MHVKAKKAMVNIPLPVTITKSSSTTMQISDIESSFIAANYTNPNGCNPVSFQNFLFVWPSQGVGTGVPWGQQAMASAPAGQQSASISGSYSATPYVVGYSCGPSVGSAGATTYPNISATAEIPATWDLNQVLYTTSSLGITSAQTTLVTFNYNFPQGFNPNVNKSWIGFWNGYVIPYNNAPANSAAITLTTSQGTAAMTGLGLAPKGQYTAALFTSGYNTDPSKLTLTTIAVVIQFETGAKIV